ncbi:MAG: TRAP transporter substrate-binding protein DctP [Alphaproteobacteria bacterium]|nr:TRAP transporter substrate-binding protein DctP [Alphaproteobacteria bacterium]
MSTHLKPTGRCTPAAAVRRWTSRASVVAGTFAVAGAIVASSALAEVTIRITSDTGGPPHPAAISMENFKEKVEKAIPGAQVRTFFSSALYKNPEAVEAMTEGNLEMAWGQFGKTAQVDPYMSVVVGPMLLTTPGAVNSLDSFETVQMLKKRFNDIHGVKMFGSAHLSFYMGAGSGKRLLTPDDFSGKKIRSMGPAENAMLKAFGANPTTMAFGDVPPALETGVIDGLLTSLGGFNQVKEQAPYFSIAGINGIVGDYYYVAASTKWWNSLKPEHQKILEKIVMEETLPLAKKLNFCNDKRLIDKYGTEDPSKPGIYIMKDEEKQRLADKLGTATADWIKSNTPSGAHQWVDKFKQEAKAAVAANPLGSNWLEKTNCEELAPVFAKYVKK